MGGWETSCVDGIVLNCSFVELQIKTLAEYGCSFENI